MKLHSILCVLFLAGCNVVQPTADLPKLGESNWKLVAIEQKPVSYGDRAYLQFDEKENKISGKAACNTFSADYEMAGQKIVFKGFVSTKMYCEGIMDDENQIITQLQKTSRHEVKSDKLYFYDEGKVLLTFKR